MADHLCVAYGCGVNLPAHLLMCRRHWFRVPKALRDPIYALYRPGQDAATAGPEYLAVVDEAIAAVRESETPHA